MLDVAVIDAAAAALDPVRSRLLAELATPASANALASRLGLPCRKINYHLRTPEVHGLVAVSGERRWGGLTLLGAFEWGGQTPQTARLCL